MEKGNLNRIDELYFRVYYWMMTRLHLHGIELLLFAHVLSFWENGKTMYQSARVIAELLGCRREKVCRAQKELVKQHFLIKSQKRQPGRSTYAYEIDIESIIDRLPESIRLQYVGVVEKSHTDMGQNRTTTCDEKSHNKIIKTTTSHNDREEDLTENESHPISPPSLQEIKEYAAVIKSHNDPDTFFNYYSKRNWKTDDGQPIRSWKALFRKGRYQPSDNTTNYKKETYYESELKNPLSVGSSADFDKPDRL